MGIFSDAANAIPAQPPPDVPAMPLDDAGRAPTDDRPRGRFAAAADAILASRQPPSQPTPRQDAAPVPRQPASASAGPAPVTPTRNAAPQAQPDDTDAPRPSRSPMADAYFAAAMKSQGATGGQQQGEPRALSPTANTYVGLAKMVAAEPERLSDVATKLPESDRPAFYEALHSLPSTKSSFAGELKQGFTRGAMSANAAPGEVLAKMGALPSRMTSDILARAGQRESLPSITEPDAGIMRRAAVGAASSVPSLIQAGALAGAGEVAQLPKLAQAIAQGGFWATQTFPGMYDTLKQHGLSDAEARTLGAAGSVASGWIMERMNPVMTALGLNHLNISTTLRGAIAESLWNYIKGSAGLATINGANAAINLAVKEAGDALQGKARERWNQNWQELKQEFAEGAVMAPMLAAGGHIVSGAANVHGYPERARVAVEEQAKEQQRAALPPDLPDSVRAIFRPLDATRTYSFDHNGRTYTIDATHDVPLTGGISRDGNTVYVDKGVPEQFIPQIAVHEIAEARHGLDSNQEYPDAHNQLAVPAEREWLAKHGLDYDATNKALEPHIRAAKDRENPVLPDDMLTKPMGEEGHDAESPNVTVPSETPKDAVASEVPGIATKPSAAASEAQPTLGLPAHQETAAEMRARLASGNNPFAASERDLAANKAWNEQHPDVAPGATTPASTTESQQHAKTQAALDSIVAGMKSKHPELFTDTAKPTESPTPADAQRASHPTHAPTAPSVAEPARSAGPSRPPARADVSGKPWEPSHGEAPPSERGDASASTGDDFLDAINKERNLTADTTTPQRPMSSETKRQVEALITKMLGRAAAKDMQWVPYLLTREGRRAVGIQAGRLIQLVTNTGIEIQAAHHEAVHWVIENILTPAEQAELRTAFPNEEDIANAFILYAQKGDWQSVLRGTKEWTRAEAEGAKAKRTLIDNALRMLHAMYVRVKGLFGANRGIDKVHELFDRLERGKLAERDGRASQPPSASAMAMEAQSSLSPEAMNKGVEKVRSQIAKGYRTFSAMANSFYNDLAYRQVWPHIRPVLAELWNRASKGSLTISPITPEEAARQLDAIDGRASVTEATRKPGMDLAGRPLTGHIGELPIQPTAMRPGAFNRQQALPLVPTSQQPTVPPARAAEKPAEPPPAPARMQPALPTETPIEKPAVNPQSSAPSEPPPVAAPTPSTPHQDDGEPAAVPVTVKPPAALDADEINRRLNEPDIEPSTDFSKLSREQITPALREESARNLEAITEKLTENAKGAKFNRIMKMAGFYEKPPKIASMQDYHEASKRLSDAVAELNARIDDAVRDAASELTPEDHEKLVKGVVLKRQNAIRTQYSRARELMLEHAPASIREMVDAMVKKGDLPGDKEFLALKSNVMGTFGDLMGGSRGSRGALQAKYSRQQWEALGRAIDEYWRRARDESDPIGGNIANSMAAKLDSSGPNILRSFAPPPLDAAVASGDRPNMPPAWRYFDELSPLLKHPAFHDESINGLFREGTADALVQLDRKNRARGVLKTKVELMRELDGIIRQRWQSIGKGGATEVSNSWEDFGGNEDLAGNLRDAVDKTHSTDMAQAYIDALNEVAPRLEALRRAVFDGALEERGPANEDQERLDYEGEASQRSHADERAHIAAESAADEPGGFDAAQRETPPGVNMDAEEPPASEPNFMAATTPAQRAVLDEDRAFARLGAQPMTREAKDHFAVYLHSMANWVKQAPIRANIAQMFDGAKSKATYAAQILASPFERSGITAGQRASMREKAARTFVAEGLPVPPHVIQAARDRVNQLLGQRNATAAQATALKEAQDQLQELLSRPSGLDHLRRERTLIEEAIRQHGVNEMRTKALDAIQYAIDHHDELLPRAREMRAVYDAQWAEENRRGIGPDYTLNYMRRVADTGAWMGGSHPWVVFSSKAPHSGSGYKVTRAHRTLGEFIGSGAVPKSLDSVALLRSRLEAGGEAVALHDLAHRELFNTQDPAAAPGTYIMQPIKGGKAPAGYEPIDLGKGVTVAVRSGYERYIHSLVDPSGLQGTGWKALKLATQTAKHGVLLFDMFHAARTAFQFAAGQQFGITGKSANIVRHADLVEAVLKHDNATIQEMENSGELPAGSAEFARKNRAAVEEGIKAGLNAMRIDKTLGDDLYKTARTRLEHSSNPIARLGSRIMGFNPYVFQTMTRSAMTLHFLQEMERTGAGKLTGSARAEKVREIAHRVNVIYGNIGKQGLLKSATAQELFSFVFLAPGWVETRARMEAGALADVAKLAGKDHAIGTYLATVGAGAAAMFVANQLINMATRNQPTWKNPEDDQKLSAYIPDVAGRGPGFFVSPFSIVGDLGHSIYTIMQKKPTAGDALMQVATNKLSPLARAGVVGLSGHTLAGEKIPTTGGRVAETIKTAIPQPIFVSGAMSDAPGALQQRAMGMLGVKADLAQTADQRLAKLAREWSSEHGKAPRVSIEPIEGRGYGDLTRAILTAKDDDAVFKQVATLKDAGVDVSMPALRKHFKEWVAAPLTGSQKNEQAFMRTLTAEQVASYRAMRKARKDAYWRLMRILPQFVARAAGEHD